MSEEVGYKCKVIWNDPVIICPNIPEALMKKTDDLPYMEKNEKKETIKEMIYGSGETLSEIKKKSDEQREYLITE